MNRKTKVLRLNSIRRRYQEKKNKKQLKALKKKRVILRNKQPFYYKDWQRIFPTSLQAPSKFDFVKNTDSFLEYLNLIGSIIKYGTPVKIDLSNVKELSVDTIALLIAHILDRRFNKNVPIQGNAPSDPALLKLFTESGFYKFVKSKGKFKCSDSDLLHKESNFKVKPDIAERATILSCSNCCITDEDKIESVYNILIELMSNTHHHSNLDGYGRFKWWLYVHNHEQGSSITFLDLGVGIFRSRVVKDMIKKMGLKLKLVDNLTLVKDLLEGKIQSRIEIDNEIRGKGLPQIVEYAKGSHFSHFKLISNDVWVDIQSGDKKKLSNVFRGTIFSIELCKN